MLGIREKRILQTRMNRASRGALSQLREPTVAHRERRDDNTVRFLYFDPGLVNELGHHANFCRAITHEFHARAIPTVLFAHRELTEKLKQELRARAHFRIYTYGNYDTDPVIAWLKSFETASRVTLQDLERIGGIEPDELVYMN